MFSKYYEIGLVPIPTTPKSKQPVKIATGFDQWALSGISLEKVEEFETKCPIEKGFGVGILCGPASGICVIDIDTDDPEILKLCPTSPIVRRGKKGEARFFQWSPELDNARFQMHGLGGEVIGIDLLVNRKYIIVPPSIHPDTGKPYQWLTPDTLENFDVSDLPKLSPAQVGVIRDFFGGSPSTPARSSVELSGVWHSPDGVRCPHGSHNRVLALAHGLITECTPLTEAIEKLIQYDEEHHKGVTFFEDKRPGVDRGADPKSNAARLYGNLIKKVNEERLKKGMRPQVAGSIRELDLSQFKTDTPLQYWKPYPKPRGIMSDFLEYCELMGKGKQDALAMGGSIALMSVISCNRFKTKVRGLDVWPNLYVLNLGYSGFGKDVSQRLLGDLLANHRLIGSGNYRSSTSIIQTLPEQQERLDIIDEASSFLKAMMAGEFYQSEMVEILSTLFSRASNKFHGISSAGHGSNFGACFNPCVNILASTTPKGFKESVNQAMASKGLMPRFLTFFQKDMGHWKGMQDVSRAEDIKERIQGWVDGFVESTKRVHPDFNPPRNYVAKRTGDQFQDQSQGVRFDPVEIPFSKAAHDKWLMFERENHYKAAKEPEAFESAFFGRFAELSAKLALLDCLSQNDGEIQVRHFDWAVSMVERCWENSRPLYQLSSAENRMEASHIRVIEIIKDAGGMISKTDFAKKTQWLNGKQRDDLLKSLEESETIEQVTAKQKGAGRPKVMLMLKDTTHHNVNTQPAQKESTDQNTLT